MAKKKPKPAKRPPAPKVARSPEAQANKHAASPRNGVVPPPEHRWKPGQSGNPAGRSTAGAHIRQEVNTLAEINPTSDVVRAIANGPKEKTNRRAAAVRYLRLVESGDIADFEPWLLGKATL